MQVPETRYARNGQYSIAYQVFGVGDLSLVFLPAFVSHVELIWDEPLAERYLRRLGSFSRVVMLDKRGTGLSDRVPPNELPTLEERLDDVRVVMDAAGVERAAVLGASEGGAAAILFAASHPQRVSALVLWSTFPCWGFPDPTPREEFEAYVAAQRRGWETGDFDLGAHFADLTADEKQRVGRWMSRYRRSAASPGAAEALLRMSADWDVRPVLPSIGVPTLCMARTGDDNAIPTRYIAESIPGARYVEFPGRSHIAFFGDQEGTLGEIQEFLTGVRVAPVPDTRLATVLFTDIVASTEKVAEIGDRRWADLVKTHHDTVRSELAKFDGLEMDTAGDGFFARFDGPARAIRCARAIAARVSEIGLEVRAGLHTGECQLMEGKVGGIAVHIGARIAQEAQPGEVLVSSTVKDLVAGSGIQFEDRGAHELTGVPGEWQLYAVSASG